MYRLDVEYIEYRLNVEYGLNIEYRHKGGKNKG